MFAAAAGLEAFLHKKGTPRRALLRLWALSAAFSIGCFLYTVRDGERLGTIFGVLLLTALGFSVLLAGLARAGETRPRLRLVSVFLFLVLVDVSTVALWHIRTLTYPLPPMALDIPAADSIGLVNEQATRKARLLLSVKAVSRLRAQGLPIEALPALALYARVHVSEPVGGADFQVATAETGRRSLALGPEARGDRSLDVFLAEDPPPEKAATGRVVIEHRSYNELALRVDAAGPSLLFVRDADFPPYWRARVDGAEVPVHRALGAFKALRVPGGTSQILLRFVPRDVVWSLRAAYGVIVLWAATTAIVLRRGPRGTP